MALPEPVPLCRLRRQQRLAGVLIPELTCRPPLLRSRAQNLSARHLYPLGPHTLVLLTPLIAQSLPTNTLANQNPSPHELSRLVQKQEPRNFVAGRLLVALDMSGRDSTLTPRFSDGQS